MGKTRRELCDKIRHYCNGKYEFADELARTYGWPIGKWNVLHITTFGFAFSTQYDFNEDISEWDVSNATSLTHMFYDAHSFNQDLSMLNTSKVKKMHFMFEGASSFNGDMSMWDHTSKSQQCDLCFMVHDLSTVTY